MGEEEKFRRRLIAVLELMEERSSVLAAEIANDLPEFTVHDVSHAKGVWVLADRIAGPNLTLTPVETFVLGAAVLLHDLGLAAAYTNGIGSLESGDLWLDAIAAVFRKETERMPIAEEIAQPPDEIRGMARRRVLRELHARHAEVLATAHWEDRHGNQYALLEEPALRETLGPVIGQIAHSHWMPVSSLSDFFPEDIGAPPGAASDWTVRPLVLACLLRLADASHLDGSRAPGFPRILRSVNRESAAHWDFQEHLSQPLLRGDRFVFNGTPFDSDEAEAWWLCADTLGMVDREFRSVDSLLADRGQPRLAVRGVFGAEDLALLAKFISTRGWSPIDAKVRVSNVVRLVERLGGRELYGSRPEVPLRELIQNGTDAVRARRVLDGLGDDWGSVVISVTESDREEMQWLEVTDTGVGMSRMVLTDHLLDFGVSFWDSEQVIDEFPRLMSSGFDSVGRFGIGFFSVFMWGEDVDVVSLRYDAQRADTYILEFRGGVGKRPLLRKARADEQMREPGTRVRVLLDNETIWRLGIDLGEEKSSVLRYLCGWLAPATEVDLLVEEDGKREVAVKAGDWISKSFDELGAQVNSSPMRSGLPYPPPVESAEEQPEEKELDPEEAERLAKKEEEERIKLEQQIDRVKERAMLIEDDDGRVIGRLAMGAAHPLGAVTAIGGLRATSLYNVTGILLAEPMTASRNAGLPLVSPEQLAAWASDQARRLVDVDPSEALELAETVWTCGGDPADLPIALTAKGLMSTAQIEAWAAERDELIVIQDAALQNDERPLGRIELDSRVVAVAMTPAYLVLDHDFTHSGEVVGRWPMSIRGQANAQSFSLVSALAGAVYAAWGAVPDSDEGQGRAEHPVGTRDGKTVRLESELWRRPLTD